MELFSVETAPYVRQAVCRMITCNCKTQDFLPLAHVQFDDGVSTLGRTDIYFVESAVRVNGQCYGDVVLMRGLSAELELRRVSAGRRSRDGRSVDGRVCALHHSHAVITATETPMDDTMRSDNSGGRGASI